MDIGQIAACNIFHLRTVGIHAIQTWIVITLKLEENFTAVQIVINHSAIIFPVEQFYRLGVFIYPYQRISLGNINIINIIPLGIR